MIRKKITKLVIIAAITTIITTATVLAETNSITNFTVQSGGSWGTVKDGNTKVDNDQYAYVRLTKRSNASTVYARVKKGATVATDELPIKSLNQTKSVKYKISVKKGDTMKIQFQATTQTQTISGKWTS